MRELTETAGTSSTIPPSDWKRFDEHQGNDLGYGNNSSRDVCNCELMANPQPCAYTPSWEFIESDGTEYGAGSRD